MPRTDRGHWPAGTRRWAGDTRSQALLNVGASGVAGAFTLWLLPFVSTSVGPEAVGIWAFATSIAAFAAVADAGLASTVIRQAVTHQQFPESDAIAEVHAASALYAGLALFAVGLGLVLALTVNSVLRVPHYLVGQAPIAAFLVSLDFAVVLGTSPWTGIVRGAERFDLVFAASVIGTVVGVAAALVLVPRIGLIGAAGSQLALHVVARLIVLGGVRHVSPWFRATPRRPSLLSLRRVGTFSIPLLVSSIATQVGIGTDILVVGAVVGPAAAGYVALGVRIPAFAIGVVVVALDAAFPRLVRRAVEGHTATYLTTVRLLQSSTLLGVTLFGFLATHAGEILSLWLGSFDATSLAFFVAYCAIWTINLPARVLSLTLTAANRHHRVPVLIVAEHSLNLVCSIAMVSIIGPVGAAVSTLLAIILSNGIGFPLLSRNRVGIGLTAQARACATGALVGSAAVTAGVLAGRLASGVEGAELAVAGIVSLAAAGAGQTLIVRTRGASTYGSAV